MSYQGTAVIISAPTSDYIKVKSAEKGKRGEGKEGPRGRNVRGKGGNPHFCYGFRVPPFPLSFIPLDYAQNITGINRLTLWSKVSLQMVNRTSWYRYQSAHPKEQSVPTHG